MRNAKAYGKCHENNFNSHFFFLSSIQIFKFKSGMIRLTQMNVKFEPQNMSKRLDHRLIDSSIYRFRIQIEI